MSPSNVTKDDLVVVTGANGFLASHTIRQLLDEGYKVRGTVRDSTSKKCDFLNEWIANGDDLELVHLDLNSDMGWNEAMDGAGVVCHMASPCFFECRRSQAEKLLYKPARDGTKRALQAAKSAGTVKKFVQTSSLSAIIGGRKAPAMLENPEEQWTNLKFPRLNPYFVSKTIAEKAAWDFVQKEKDEGNECCDRIVINPCVVMGPPFSKSDGESQKILREFLMYELPIMPDLAIGIVDVRDVATMHRLAFEIEECSGNRFAAQSKSITYADISKQVRAEFGQYGYSTPWFVVPYIGFWFASWIVSLYATLILDYGKGPRDVSMEKTRRVMGLELRDWKESINEHGHKALQIGVKGFKQTRKYKQYLSSKSEKSQITAPTPTSG
jgi:dihydroflavonol-4-reductase